MATIIKFEGDAENWYDRGRMKAKSGDHVDAIDCFHQALKRDPDCYWVLEELFHAYMALGEIDEAIYLARKMIALRPQTETGYTCAVDCCLEVGDMDGTVYYVGMGIDEGAITPETELKIPRDAFRAAAKRLLEKEDVDPDPLPDGQEPAVLRETLSAFGLDEGAIRRSLMVFSLSLGRFTLSAEVAERMLERDPNNILCHCSALVAEQQLGRTEEAQKHIDYLVSTGLEDINDMYHAAGAFMAAGYDDLAMKYFTILHGRVPYHCGVNLAYAIGLYDRGKVAAAREIMVMLRKIYPHNTVVAYYARHIAEGKVKFIPMDIEIPDVERARRVGILHDLFAAYPSPEQAREALASDEMLREIVLWSFQSHDMDLEEEVGNYLINLPEWIPFIADQLIGTWIGPTVKETFLLLYLIHSENKSFTILVGNALMRYTPRIPHLRDVPELLKPYAAVYAKFVVLKETFETRLTKVYRSVIATMRAPGFGKVEFTPEAMAAYIAYVMNVHGSTDSVDSCADVFGCTEEELSALIDRFGLERLPVSSRRGVLKRSCRDYREDVDWGRDRRGGSRKNGDKKKK